MKTILHILSLTLLCLIALPQTAEAQSAKGSFQTGLNLMKRGKYCDAIKHFQTSMVLDDSPTNTKECRNRIATCTKRCKHGDTKKDESLHRSLAVNKKSISFLANPDAEQVQVTCEPKSDGWSVQFAAEDTTWIHVNSKDDGKTMIILCDPQTGTSQRSGKLHVVNGSLRETIDIYQRGNPLKFEVRRPEIYGVKKKLKKPELYVIPVECNSAITYEDGRTWKVDYMPDWCTSEAQPEERDKAENIMLEDMRRRGENTFNLTQDEVLKRCLIVLVRPLPKEDPYYKSGRQDKIILRCQDETREILVTQNK